MECNLNVIFVIILQLLLVIVPILCFNFEIREPLVKRGEQGSYFGYSVAQHITKEINAGFNDKWLLVGAPLGQNIQPQTNHSGALFKCGLGLADECEQVETDGRRSDTLYDDDEDLDDEMKLKPPASDEIKNGQWMGVSVKSQKPGGMVMVCGHRYIEGQHLDQAQHGLGLCYSLKNDLQWDQPWGPCKGRSMENEHLQFGLCQAGVSLALLPDGTALIGSPGPYTWRGTLFAVAISGRFMDRDKTIYYGPLSDTAEPIDKYSYLGMSVTAGNFFDLNITYYASGAPRSKHNGQVYFFEKTTNQMIMNIKLRISGQQFTSNFGYEMLSADVNNDGYDDLLVSAPFYYNIEKAEGGAVYVYYNLRSCTDAKCDPDLILTGPTESRFGFALSALGDINKDGYIDVAIGAPYEQGGGAIYIYLGGKKGLNVEPSQKIQIPNNGIKTLGYSLSGGLDMDGNGYPDLLTGCYESDLAILFKTRPIIHITPLTYDTNNELTNIDVTKLGCANDKKSKTACFSFEVCFEINSKNFKLNNGEIIVQSNLTADIDKGKSKFARVLFKKTSTSATMRQYRLKNNQFKYCEREVVYIKENIHDILSPIKFRITYFLINNENLSPILNQSAIKEFTAKFQKDCGSDDQCQSKLILTAELLRVEGIEPIEGKKDLYSLNLGSVDEINLSVNVRNDGESAYETQLFVIHSPALSYIALNDKSTNVECTTTSDTLVVCTLGNPFQSEKSVDLGLRFESKDNKMTKENELEFKVFVNSTSHELSKRTHAQLTAVIKKKAEVKISGGATPFVFFGGVIKGESGIKFFDEIGMRVWHTYQVVNDGPWHVEDLEVLIYWPLEIASAYEHGKWLLYLENDPVIEGLDDGLKYCTVMHPARANVLNITDRFDGREQPPENFMMPPISQNMDPSSPFINAGGNTRRRRDAQYVAPPEKLMSSTGKRNSFSLDCGNDNSVKCAIISCKIKKLQKNNEATIKIRSRLWNTTLVEEYSNMDSVKIISRAKIIVSDEIVEQDTKDDTAKAETVAYPEISAQGGPISLWVYIAAAVGGLLLLLLIILILYKTGFFKRNRVQDPTLMGNLTKVGENETLLNK